MIPGNCFFSKKYAIVSSFPCNVGNFIICGASCITKCVTLVKMACNVLIVMPNRSATSRYLALSCPRYHKYVKICFFAEIGAYPAYSAMLNSFDKYIYQ